MRRRSIRTTIALACWFQLALTLAAGLTLTGFAEDAAVPLRQRPGEEPRPIRFPPYIYESVPDINSSASDFVPVPDRWRQFYVGKWYDPYNQNVLKGDIPIFGEPGEEWFFSADLVSDTSYESLRIPVPVGGSSTSKPGSLNTFGKGDVQLLNENLAMSFSLIRGNTTFKPPDFELRVAPVFNFNHATASETGILRIDPSKGEERDNAQLGFQELFIDYHLANLTDRYDFVSSRIGIQKFQSDFRGFVFSDEAPGVRLFGNFENNLYQYNLAWFSRLEKDTNSNLNTTFDMRHEDVAVANVYLQDTPALGHTLQFSYIYRADTAGDQAPHYDDNGFLRRPASIGDEREKNLYTSYFGISGDGHFGRINSTSALYYVTGAESHNPIAGREQDINAAMGALELSYDIDWIRLRASVLWASGDNDPYDGDANGFDAIFDSPNFAGGDLSFWQRQAIPLVGGGEVFLVNRNSFLPNLRAGKEEGQSNFVNPGLRLYNAGIDFELTPRLKLVTNATFLQFDQLGVLEAVRQDGSFNRDIGFDLSAGLLYRPFLNNNVQLRGGSAVLFPSKGLKALYGDDCLYNMFTNLILQY
ncbi:MAG: hypothetical protein K1X83_06180 [Oligoflexia bacterium]|nr:hypothetical protein [Oligoflexia bacterium]